MVMPKEITLVLCGRKLGTKTDPERYGECDRELNHGTSGSYRGCSSPELRRYRREHTAKTREKQRKAKLKAEAPAPVVDDELLYNEPEPSAFERMLAKVPETSPTVLAERQQREAEDVARRREARLRRIENERFITEALDKHARGEEIDHRKLTEVCVSYLLIHDDIADKFRLDRDSRIRRGFNTDGIGERELSSQLYGPETLSVPPALDETSFRVRLGRFLGVQDSRRQLWGRHHMAGVKS